MRYPGDTTDPAALSRLADAYRAAVEHLLESRRDPLGAAPARLLAIHAIELYLNAFLLRRGQTPSELRGMQHDLSVRITAASDRGLVLRKATIRHCQLLAESREYLVTRYDPDGVRGCSPLNRLGATLAKIARKTSME